MKFGPVSVKDALGCILAHSQQVGKMRLKKGRELTQADLTLLQEAGVETITIARLSVNDIGEDEAARSLAQALLSDGVELAEVFTGRCNIYAQRDGLFAASEALVNAINSVDPAITLATLPNNTPVQAGRMVATVKIIPFAVSKLSLQAACMLEGNGEALLLHPWQKKCIALLATELPVLKPSVMDKTRTVLEQRLATYGARLSIEERCTHDAKILARHIKSSAAQNDLLILFGASAVVDEADVLPQAIRLAGGEVHHLGMPVDPGNLLLLGALGNTTIIGAPGCARSPAENGFDWVLMRIMAGQGVTRDTIAAMGVGGLLMEIHSRPQPRENLK